MNKEGGERRDKVAREGEEPPTKAAAKPRQFSLTEEDGEPVYVPEPENKESRR